MNIAQFVATHESLQEEEIKDSGDHEYRGDFHSPVTPLDVHNAEEELETEYKAIDDVDTGIDTAIDAVSALDELHSSIKEDVPEDGTLSKMEEVSVTAALESIMTSIGLPHVVPTTESLNAKQRTAQIIASLESKSQGIFEKIINAFKRTVDNVIAFIQNLFRNTWVLAKYSEWIKTKLGKVSSQTPTKSEMVESAKAMFAADGSNYKSVELMDKTALTLIDMSLVAVDEINDLNFKFSNHSARISNDLWVSYKLARNHGNYGYLANGRAFADTKDQFIVSSLYDRAVAVGTPGSTSEVLTHKEMEDTLKKANDIIAGIRKIDSKRSVLRNLISRITQAVAELTTSYAGVVSKKASEKNLALRIIAGKRRLLNTAVGRFPLEAFKIAKAFIDYVRHSLKYYPS